jgi:glycosyltransferase involved in cell wall biosynthesis
MRILFRHLDPGKSGAVSSFVKQLEGYCERFPDDDLTLMCAEHSPLVELGRFANCHLEIVGRKIPREAHLLGWGDVAIRRVCRKRAIDVFLSINTGVYVRSMVPQVLAVKNAYQVYPLETGTLHPRSKLRVELLRRLFRRSLRLSSAAIVESEVMAKYLREIPGCPERVAVLPKAVVSEQNESACALSPWIAKAIAQAAGAVKLLYVATAAPHKNHRLLARVMEEFRKQRRAVCLVASIGTDGWLREAGSSTAGLLASGHVIPLGWVDKNELAALYRACDLCVMPSLLESLSSAHLEAMYWKRPQVVSDLPYARDLCGDAALYADPHDPQPWVAAIEQLLGDAQLRDQLVSAGEKRVATYPANWIAMAEQLRSVLLKTMSAR